jgi:methionyl-tRNA formyltransferase
VPQPLKIALFGLPLAGLLLQADGHEIALAALAPVEHVGARRLARRLPSGRLLDAHRLAGSLAGEVDRALELCEIDLLVSWFWTRRLPQRWLEKPRLAAIGVHPSLLPRHRGPNPYYWAIDQGDSVTGATVHLLTAEYDTGEILLQKSLAIEGRNSWQLARALDRVGLELLRAVVRRVAAGEQMVRVAQEQSQATWAPEPHGEHLRVRWEWPTSRILQRISALAPVPGLAIEIGNCKLFVTRASPVEWMRGALGPAEAVVAERPQPHLCIGTGDGAVAIEQAVMGWGSELEPGQVLDAMSLAKRLGDGGVARVT